MTEKSFIWDSGGGGDASAHSEADTALMFGALAGDRLVSTNKGVLRGVLNALVPSSPGAGQVRIGTGAAIVDGHPYINDANRDFTPTTPSVGTTGHRIVARCVWTGTVTSVGPQQVRLVDLSSADGTATIPAMTQTPGGTFDIPICSFKKTTGGVIQDLADLREFAGQPADIIDALAASITNAATGVWKGYFWAPGGGCSGSAASSTSLGLLGCLFNGSGIMTPTPSGATSDAFKGMGDIRTDGSLNADTYIYNPWQIDPATDSFEMSVVCSLDNDTNNEFFFGLAASAVPADANNRLGFRRINNGNLFAFTDNGGSEVGSSFDFGAGGSASPGTVYALKIVGSAGIITFYVNGTAVFSTSSNVSSSATIALFGVRSTTAAQDILRYRDLNGRMKAA